VPLDRRIAALVALGNRVTNPEADQPMPLQRTADSRTGALFAKLVMRPGAKMHDKTHRMVPVEAGHILVRLYRPHPGDLPLHVFLHGGGWCTGNLDQRDARCQDLAAAAGCLVASVDYRLAPENQYPTQPEDCYAALCWLVAHAAELGINPDVVSVGGESAGGNLAAVVCLMARDRLGPRLAFQMLEVPATDLTMSQPSISELATGYLLTRQGMETYVRWYIEDPSRITEPYASPLHAADLRGLPPAWIMTCEYDPLRSDGEAYAAKLRAAGVPVQYQQLAGHIHPSFAFSRLTASARRYQAEAAAALQAGHRRAALAVAPR
jgi:acetyl esterase